MKTPEIAMRRMKEMKIVAEEKVLLDHAGDWEAAAELAIEKAELEPTLPLLPSEGGLVSGLPPSSTSSSSIGEYGDQTTTIRDFVGIYG